MGVAPPIIELVEESPWRWRIDPTGDMRVPGIVYASRDLLPDVVEDRSLEQVANVATLPGIVGASYAMPDVHWGYGFPIGGVAATDVDDGGVISPGGVGFDISCGVRLLRSDITRDELAPRLTALMDELQRSVPAGMGKGAVWDVDDQTLQRLLLRGAREAVEQGFGVDDDLARCEDGGALDDADPVEVSDRALARGLQQVGSLGSGNHFLELQAVDRVDDDVAAGALGIREGQVCMMIHSGSRGLGHQVCTDHVRLMEAAMARYGITVPDRQLASVPVRSPEGQAYLGAMNAAANYGRANRQLLTYAARRAVAQIVGTDHLPLVYDVSHNLAKIEDHPVDGRERELCVHRKGATRALPPHHRDLPPDLAEVGQPVFVPGSMGTASYLLVGASSAGAFHSCAHGAGRTMSRTASRRQTPGRQLQRELEAAGVAVRAQSSRAVAEEAPHSYKDVDEVVATVAHEGLARPVARLVPIGVVKG